MAKGKKTTTQRKALVAKAGKRRPHNIVKDSQGNYISAPFKAREREQVSEPKVYMMTHDVKASDRIPVPVGHHRREGLAKIASMKRGTRNLSDPFVFDRMATHFVNGLVEL